MTREEHLKFCKVCKNQRFDKDRGIICNLTNEYADFDGSCPDFLEDAIKSKEEKENIFQKLKDNSNRASTAIKVFWGICLLNVIAVVSGYLELELLESINSGNLITEEEASMSDLRQGIVGILQFALIIVSIITFLNWFRRAYGNIHRLNLQA